MKDEGGGRKAALASGDRSKVTSVGARHCGIAALRRYAQGFSNDTRALGAVYIGG